MATTTRIATSRPRRYGAVDVYYPDTGGATAAVVLASDPRLAAIVTEHTAHLTEVAEYRPGAFFQRELPAIRAVLSDIDPVDMLIIDGYVHLDPHGTPGLGTYVHEEYRVPVIGVAKSFFHTARHAIEVRRGTAARPLYVTAAGLDPRHAANLVRDMAGPFRMPDALRRVDALSRTGR